MLRKFLFLGVLILCSLGFAMAGPAQATISPVLQNGDFETGDFTAWNTEGNVGIDTPPYVISGNYSAYLDTWDANTIAPICSWLWSNDIFPTNVPMAVKVQFKVRYYTQESISPTQYDDPFHAMLKFGNGKGDVTLVTMSSNAVSAATGFSVQDLTTGAILPFIAMPNFVDGVALFCWDWASNVMLVSGTIPYNSCDSVNIRFDICSALAGTSGSSVDIDDVAITFVNGPGASATWWKSPPGAPVLCK